MSIPSGVEILSQAEVVTETYTNTIACSFLGFIAFFIIFCAFYESYSKNKKLFIAAIVNIGLIIAFLVTFVFCLFNVSFSNTFTITEYKATISQDANFYDIYGNYEIVGQEGSIFTLREKEND